MARMSLRDDQWERIRPLLPGKQTDCGVTAKDNRTLLEAVIWIARTGAPWRDLAILIPSMVRIINCSNIPQLRQVAPSDCCRTAFPLAL